MIVARRRARVAALPAALAFALALAGLAAACGPAATATPEEIPTGSMLDPSSATPPASLAVPASPQSGVLVDIDATGLADVTGFTLRTAAGEEIRFRLGTLENGVEFPPGHLPEHLATSTPVRAYFRVEGADLVVYRLEDAE